MLTRQKRLLKCAALAGLCCAAEKAAQLTQLDFFYNWGVKTWEYYQHSSREVRIAELEEITPCTPQQIQAEVAEIVAENAAGASAEVQAQVVDLVCQIPASIRRGLRRPDDPSGITVPKTVKLESADDLIKLLPHKLSRFKPGDRIAGIPWQLQEKIGDGGFGEVWKAHNPKYPGLPPVALKFCLDGIAAGNLEHEARVIDRVMRQAQHPGIVALKQVYESDPPCLEYEFVTGGELSKLIEEWGPPRDAAGFRRSAKVVQRLAEIVGFAHRLAEPIVHRDLKPANVLVVRLETGKLHFKIADFGIGGLAATVANQKAALASKEETRLSQQRGAYTPVYSSPQQRKGGPADVRDDVHALGIIWFQLLVGDPAAELPLGTAWIKKLERQGMSVSWIELLVECVEHDPADRPSDAVVLAERIRALRDLTQAPAVKVAPAIPSEVAQSRAIVAHVQSGLIARPAEPEKMARPVAKDQSPSTGRWTLETMKKQLEMDGATGSELQALSAIFRWGQEAGVCEFQASNTPSFVIQIPTCGAKVTLLTVQGRQLRFYMGHFVGGYDETKRANYDVKKFPHAYELADRYCLQLNNEFGWNLKVRNGNGGFCEPTRPLADVADPNSLSRFLKILSEVAAVAALPPIASFVRRKTIPPFMNSIGVQFNAVPSGAFWMGSEAGKPSDNHVAINQDFYLGIYPVTQGQWQSVMGDNPSHLSRSGSGKELVESIMDVELQHFPVEQVSWNDAQDFLQRLNAKERLPAGTYRLPSEAEWEYASRAAAQSKSDCAFDYYFAKPTNSLTPAVANFDPWQLTRTARVGSYPANGLGLFDMHGNVWEWCADWFNAEQKYRVLRGGSWYSNSSDCRSAHRSYNAPETRYSNIGFRVARTT